MVMLLTVASRQSIAYATWSNSSTGDWVGAGLKWDLVAEV